MGRRMNDQFHLFHMAYCSINVEKCEKVWRRHLRHLHTTVESHCVTHKRL